MTCSSSPPYSGRGDRDKASQAWLTVLCISRHLLQMPSQSEAIFQCQSARNCGSDVQRPVPESAGQAKATFPKYEHLKDARGKRYLFLATSPQHVTRQKRIQALLQSAH